MGKLDTSNDRLRPSDAAQGWARIEGYGDNGTVMFCASQADAVDAERAPKLLCEAPAPGTRAWLRLNRPFVFDSIAPFWCLYLPPAMQWHGPAGEDLSRIALVRCRLVRAPARDGRDGGAARVTVVERLSLYDLRRGAVSGMVDWALMLRLTDGDGALPPVHLDGYTVLARDLNGDAGEWALLRHDTGATDLLLYGAWDADTDRMWAGRARVPQPSFS